MTSGGRSARGDPPVRQVSIEVGRGRCRLWGTAVVTARGVSVTLVGGERPHVGAVAIGIPRPSLARGGRQSATTSVVTVTGHKDDELARPLAHELARRLGQTAVVVAGVHIERPRARDFERIFRNAERALDAILVGVRSIRSAPGVSDPAVPVFPARSSRRQAARPHEETNMNWKTWCRILAVVGVVGVVLAVPTSVRAQAAEAATADVEASPTNVLASITAILGSFVYAPFKAVVLCPVSAVGAGATWLVTGGEPSPAKRVLQVGCEGDYFVTRPMLRGQAEFREPDSPSVQLRAVARPSVSPGN